MKRVRIVVILVTLFAALYHASPFLGFTGDIIIAMFLVSPFLVIYMAFTILKYGKPSEYTFDEKFYDDHEYIRNGKESLVEPAS